MSDVANFIAPLVVGLFVGFDNLRAGIALGALNMSSIGRNRMAFFFVLFESVMPLIGLTAGIWIAGLMGRWSEFIGPIVLVSTGVYVMSGAFQGLDVKKEPLNNTWLVIMLPVSLSLDNLFAGVGLGVLDFPPLLSAVVIGGASGLMSVIGLKLGSFIRLSLPSRTNFIGGLLLVAAAFVSFLGLN